MGNRPKSKLVLPAERLREEAAKALYGALLVEAKRAGIPEGDGKPWHLLEAGERLSYLDLVHVVEETFRRGGRPLL